MWWCDLARRRGGLGAVAVLALALSGCFTPMYNSLNGGLGAELQAVAVDPIQSRMGARLHDELITDLNGTGSSPPPRYRLTLTPRERVQTALVDIVSRRASNATVVVDIDYALVPIGGGAAIAKGTVTSAASYNRSEQRYANIRAARDAEVRDAKTVADEITQRIAAALSTR